jgi:hypothetical protein
VARHLDTRSDLALDGSRDTPAENSFAIFVNVAVIVMIP